MERDEQVQSIQEHLITAKKLIDYSLSPSFLSQTQLLQLEQKILNVQCFTNNFTQIDKIKTLDMIKREGEVRKQYRQLQQITTNIENSRKVINKIQNQLKERSKQQTAQSVAGIFIAVSLLISSITAGFQDNAYTKAMSGVAILASVIGIIIIVVSFCNRNRQATKTKKKLE